MPTKIKILAIRFLMHLLQDTWMPFGTTIEVYETEGYTYAEIVVAMDHLQGLGYVLVRMDGQSNYYKLSGAGVRVRNAIEALVSEELRP